MLFIVLVALAVLCSASASAIATTPSLTSFSEWKVRFGRHYSSTEEEARRQSIWIDNSKLVDSINHGNATWTAELNAFADMTPKEFQEKVLMRPAPASVALPLFSKDVQAHLVSHSVYSSDAPASFDWRDRGVVTSVKDQGSAGTCWAFSTAGNIEGQWALSRGQLVDLSPEFLVDCDGTADQAGGHADCSVFGGWPYLAYQFIQQSGGIPSESTWPYCSGKGDCYPCMLGPVSLCGPPPYSCDKTIPPKCPDAVKAASISSWEAGPSDEGEMAAYLASRGPLSVLLDATALQFYKSGVWNGYLPGTSPYLGCHKDSLNHAVLAVGYGYDDSSQESYWTIKNSWGAKWGEEGYFRIVRGSGACGINTAVTSSII